MQTEEFIVNYMNLANYIAHKKKRSLPNYIDFQELQCAAYMGLVEAANRYKPELGTCFTTYAYPRINGAINDYLRELGKISLSLDDQQDDEMPLKDTITARAETNIVEVVEEITYNLDNQAKEIFQLYFVEGYSMKDIAFRYKVTEGWVCQLVKKCRQSIKDRQQRQNFFSTIAA